MMRKLAGLVVFVVLALPGVAVANVHATTNPMALALHLGEAYWKNVPCHGALPVIAAEPVVPSASMWTYVLATPAEETTMASCPIYVSEQSWPNWYVDDLNFEAFCKTMIHEMGHLEGYSDEGAVLGTIQYEAPNLAKVPLCEHYRLYYGHHMFTPAVEEAWEREAG
jgi:hypothetical protein